MGSLGKALHDLCSNVASRGGIGQADGLGRRPSTWQIVDVVAQGVASRHGQIVEPIAPHEFGAAAVVAVPREPVAPHLKGRGIGHIEGVDGQGGLLGDAGTEVGG